MKKKIELLVPTHGGDMGRMLQGYREKINELVTAHNEDIKTETPEAATGANNAGTGKGKATKTK